ncbi:MAG: AbrB/MazE/SpoVT family DNA-binding domain-containing protein [Thaumarchaeota archaeon]|nr:AbrB/MazE/SpoVT family DNA-binding domain-containing protein [Nitrososphaerota archaeon]
MKKFIEKCYKCGTGVKAARSVKEGIELNCLKCVKCGEEYFTSSELVRFDILKGTRRLVRKFGVLGSSTIARIPNSIVEELNIKPGDYGVFEKRPDGILIRPYHAGDLGKQPRTRM